MLSVCSFSVEPGEIDIPLGCIVRAIPGSLSGRDSIDVEPLNQLDDVLALEDNEELVSQIIRIHPTSEEAENIKVSNKQLYHTCIAFEGLL